MALVFAVAVGFFLGWLNYSQFKECQKFNLATAKHIDHLAGRIKTLEMKIVDYQQYQIVLKYLESQGFKIPEEN